jgi:DNA-binding NarL/FixJ family response regulator
LPARALPARELLTLSLATPVPSPAAPHKALPPASRPLDLTPREWETLNLLAQGLTNRQIGEQLVLSVTTVNSYLRSIYSKLGVKSRTAAMRYARDHQPD